MSSPEQLAALGLELLDLLAQLLLAAFEILCKTRQAAPEAPLRVGLEDLLVQTALVLRQRNYLRKSTPRAWQRAE